MNCAEGERGGCFLFKWLIILWFCSCALIYTFGLKSPSVPSSLKGVLKSLLGCTTMRQTGSDTGDIGRHRLGPSRASTAYRALIPMKRRTRGYDLGR
jgi:hypothetical protein